MFVFSRLILLAGALGLAVGAAAAGPGAAELSLDRASVRALIAAATEEPIELELPGIGPLTVRAGPPARLDFVEGGIETTLPLELTGPDFKTSLSLRYVPFVDPLYGDVMLRCELATSEERLPVDVGLARFFEPIVLPRRVDWNLPVDHGVELSVRGYVQGVEVLDDRLVVRLGLAIESKQHAREQGP
jgi:hypothetical protein